MIDMYKWVFATHSAVEGIIVTGDTGLFLGVWFYFSRLKKNVGRIVYRNVVLSCLLLYF